MPKSNPARRLADPYRSEDLLQGQTSAMDLTWLGTEEPPDMAMGFCIARHGRKRHGYFLRTGQGLIVCGFDEAEGRNKNKTVLSEGEKESKDSSGVGRRLAVLQSELGRLSRQLIGVASMSPRPHSPVRADAMPLYNAPKDASYTDAGTEVYPDGIGSRDKLYTLSKPVTSLCLRNFGFVASRKHSSVALPSMVVRLGTSYPQMSAASQVCPELSAIARPPPPACRRLTFTNARRPCVYVRLKLIRDDAKL
ncbi:hypothetical protein C8J57DRAFT_1211606 [Mycena rebaudengoi]|nr:hypothetical protein C8J57DRAFT_1211606 [Mycena rebaudengoi]